MSKRDRNKKRQITNRGSNLTKKSESPNVHTAIPVLPKGGLIVYGVGDHLADMLNWHQDLASRIVKVIDKSDEKQGRKAYSLPVEVEAPEVLKNLPDGTQIAVSVLRYFEVIVKEIHELNPGLVCLNIDQAYTLLKHTETNGMLVYGVGAHLEDMISWHPELPIRIGRIFDKDNKKIGQKAPQTTRVIESTEVLKYLPAGVQIVISAIRYYEEIVREIYALNPGLICVNIDEAYAKLPLLPIPKKENPPVVEKKISIPTTKVKVSYALSNLQKQRLRGKEAAERWRRRFLMESVGVRKVFWGVKGIRANYLRNLFRPFMGKDDFFVDDDANLRGQVKDSLPICMPEVLRNIKGDFKIIILNHNYAQISEMLRDYGYIENVDFVEGRQLIGEDENGFIDVPCVDKTQRGMIVYGSGAHLADMQKWHPEIAWHISKLIDKDKKKIGTVAKDIGITIEPIEVLRDIPTGTEIVVSAIKYMTEIKKDIHAIQPGLICRSIDDVWREYV